MKMWLCEVCFSRIIINFKLDYTCTSAGQGGPKGFCAGEPQKRDVTDVSSNPKSSKSSSPQDVYFWHTFMSIEIKLPLVSVGTPLFYHLFYDRMWYLKQYCTYLGPKSGQNGGGQRTHARRDARTDAHQNFEASCTKALRAINSKTKLTCNYTLPISVGF